MSTTLERWPRVPPLSRGVVEIWNVSLHARSQDLPRLGALLSGDEQDRARRYHFDCDRVRFVIARGTLRTVLGRVLGEPPEGLRFRLGAHGKPELAARFASARIHFNVAHTEGLALIAVARGTAMGVDVERVRPLPDLMSIVAHFFRADERAAMERAREEDRLATFFRLWTAKEACLKARGDGLAGLERASDLVARTGSWRVQGWSPQPGYLAALACEQNLLPADRGWA